MSLLQLFATFFYIGLFTIGGGLAAIPLMQQTIVDSGLVTQELFFSMLAISESTPGPIGINMATYIGYELYGVWGGIFTTLGTVLPSLIVIIIIARFFSTMQKNPIVKAVFYGLRAAVSGMVAVAAWQVLSITVFNFSRFAESGIWYTVISIPSFIFFAVSLIVLQKTKIHPIAIVAIGAVFGIVFL